MVVNSIIFFENPHVFTINLYRHIVSEHTDVYFQMIRFAKVIDTGDVIHVEHATSTTEYACIDCGEGMIPKRGQQLRWHFAHKGDREETSCMRGESDVHRDAKHLLVYLLSKGGNIVASNECDICSTISTIDIRSFIWNSVKSEGKINERERADVLLSLDGKPTVALEVKHTHATLQRSIPWFEFEASDILSLVSLETVTTVYLKTSTHIRHKCSIDLELVKQSFGLVISETDHNPSCGEVCFCISQKISPGNDEHFCQEEAIVACRRKQRVTTGWNLPDIERIRELRYTLRNTKICLRCSKKVFDEREKPYCKSCYTLISNGDSPQTFQDGLPIEGKIVRTLLEKYRFLESIGKIEKRSGSSEWRQDYPCGGSCGRYTYNPVFYFGYRALCKMCLSEHKRGQPKDRNSN